MIFDSYLTSDRQENEIITYKMNNTYEFKCIQLHRNENFLPTTASGMPQGGLRGNLAGGVL